MAALSLALLSGRGLDEGLLMSMSGCVKRTQQGRPRYVTAIAQSASELASDFARSGFALRLITGPGCRYWSFWN